MFKSYFLVAWRNLLKNKGHAFINVFGLAVGMAGCILIFLFVQHEWSYDTFHDRQDSIFSLFIQEIKPDGDVRNRRLIPLGVPEVLAKEIPGIKSAVQLAAGDVTIVRAGQPFRETIFEADSTLFDIFTFPLLAGDRRNVLSSPSSMVISEDIANKYFGANKEGGYGQILGEIISLPSRTGLRDFFISGVMQNCPANSSLQISIVISFENYSDLPLGSNDIDGRTSTYILLKNDQDPRATEERLVPFTALHLKDRIASQRAHSQIADRDDALRIRLQPLPALHTSPNVPVGYEEPIHNPLHSYVLAAIGVLVLLIACINFMTLSIARATSRAREVGMRKAIGAHRNQLVTQFLGEAILASFMALLVGIALTYWLLPLFNNLTGRTLTLANLGDAFSVFVISSLILLVGFIAGSYPALVLSRFQPAAVLKGDLKTGGASLLMRSLVGLQFTASIALMVCASIMLQQVEFLKGKDLGFNDDMVLVFRARQGGSAATLEKYRSALAGYSEVNQVVGAGQAFSRSEDTRLWQDAEGATRIAYVYGVDYDYFELFQMKVMAGRNFSSSFATDPTSGVLVNETLVRQFEIMDPIGHRLDGFMPGLFPGAPTILGVVKDFNFKSLRNEVKPAVFSMHPNYWARFRNVFVKIRPDNVANTVEMLEEKWREVAPDVPFDYFFLDQDIQSQYQSEDNWVQIMRYATILALGISCMGLFALASLVISKRVKEIGVRKILGASIPSLLGLLSKDFTGLVLIAFAVAAPLGYFVMDAWLQDFAYRVSIGGETFIVIAALALFSVVLTVSYQTIRASLANPAATLRHE